MALVEVKNPKLEVMVAVRNKENIALVEVSHDDPHRAPSCWYSFDSEYFRSGNITAVCEEAGVTVSELKAMLDDLRQRGTGFYKFLIVT